MDTPDLDALFGDEGPGSVMGVLRGIPDPRRGNAIRHRLDEVLGIAILSVLSGFDRFTEMELFAQEREGWLRSFMELPGGIPSHDTFGDVFAALDPRAVHDGFSSWAQSLRDMIKGEVVAIDGKTVCGSKDGATKRRAIHVVSAWASGQGLVLGEVATEEKSNEIAAIPELLGMLELDGCTVTIDAMGTQKDIASAVINKKANYLLAVKLNQGGLYEGISDFFGTEMDSCDFAKTVEKSHGRIEVRECWSSTDIGWLAAYSKGWAGISGIAAIRAKRQPANTGTVEESLHYFIFSDPSMSAAAILDARRRHWGVENSLHWVLDVDFGEDHSRMRAGNCAENMSAFRHAALNLLRSEGSVRSSLNLKRKKCALSPSYLLKVVGVS